MTELDYKILELVLGTNTPISSKHLAASCDVAVNTIRSEIDLLNRDAERHGFRICMKRSIGVYCEVLDERRALPYFSHMQDFFMRARRIKKRYADRVYYLARQILSCPSGLTAEKLAQTLYISRGTILHELKNLRSLLALFGLTLVNRRGGQGLGIEGTEWAIRQFLIHLHKNYTIARKSVKSNDAPHEYGFRTLFFMDEPCYNEIYCMLQQALLSQSDFTIPIIHFPKLINLLMLCASRKRYLTGQPFDEQGTQYLRSTPEYTFFSDFCRKLPPRFRQTVQSWEIDMLTALLISFESENSFLPRSEQGREILWILIRLGIPQVVRSMFVRVGMLWVNASANSFGLIVSATNSVGNKLQKFLEVFVQGIDTASASMIGQNLGAKKIDRAGRTTLCTYAAATACAVISAAICLLIPHQIFRLFTTDESVIALGTTFLRIFTLHFFASALTGSFQAMVTGCGFVELGFLLGLLDGLICKIGFSLLFMYVFQMGYIGLWCGVACSRILPGCICVAYYISGRWKTRRLLTEDS